MARAFRGATYQIEITKRKGICRGKVAVSLDGRPLPSNLIPPPRDRRTHKVQVSVS
jgi:hypothetical protein